MPVLFKSKYRYYQSEIPVIFMRGCRCAQEASRFCTSDRRHHFLRLKGFLWLSGWAMGPYNCLQKPLSTVLDLKKNGHEPTVLLYSIQKWHGTNSR